MATYPTLATAYGSDPEPISSIKIDRSEDGTARGRSTGNDKVRLPNVVHPYLSSADKSTLDAFYTANRLIPFDYTSPTDSTLRSCIFSGPIRYERHVGDYWTATVEMEQV